MARAADTKFAKKLLAEINDLTGLLVERGLVDAQNFSAIATASDRWSVQQSGASMSVALKNRPYEEIYDELVRRRSYNLMLLDGAIIQYAYDGHGSTIDRHRLAYLPSPTLRPYQDDPELYLFDDLYIEIVGHQVLPIPIRFDYDGREGVAKNLVHPVSHLTLGQYKHCRIPVGSAISPKVFTEFVIHSFYSMPESFRIELKQHVPLFPSTITLEEMAGVHLRVGVPEP